VRALDAAIEKAVREEDDDLSAALHAAIEAVRADLPVGLAEVVARSLASIAELPRERMADAVFSRFSPSQVAARQPLPQWLPPSRTIGGFYIVRPIGNGAGGSVFVARRAEDRNEQSAESYALKVPSYSGQNAHTLSEDQFLQLFREEAGALLTLPSQHNLAGFVTFDARARPKPILVMELVHGPTVERIIEKQELSVPTAFAILHGIASGLSAMHATGIGHFDVKPSNIILRDSQQGNFGSKLSALDAAAPVPVLVDFGLAGRKLRPGCASPYYGAPEVWDSQTYRLAADHTAADVYAYCCLAYELLTGRTLFDGESLPALIGNHLTHDGRPPRLEALYTDHHLVELAEILIAGLSPDPRARPSITDMAQALQHYAPNIEDRVWPVGAPAQA
jgi:serine/threonine protein kinase